MAAATIYTVFLFILTFFLFLMFALSLVICSQACSAPNPGTGSTGHPPPSAGWESWCLPGWLGIPGFLSEAGLTNQKVFFLKFLWIEAIITTIRAILQWGERGGMSFQLCSLEEEITEDLFFCVSWSERKWCSPSSQTTVYWPTSMLFFNSPQWIRTKLMASLCVLYFAFFPGSSPCSEKETPYNDRLVSPVTVIFPENRGPSSPIGLLGLLPPPSLRDQLFDRVMVLPEQS